MAEDNKIKCLGIFVKPFLKTTPSGAVDQSDIEQLNFQNKENDKNICIKQFKIVSCSTLIFLRITDTDCKWLKSSKFPIIVKT